MDNLEFQFDHLFREDGGLYYNAISKSPIYAAVIVYSKQLVSSLVKQSPDKLSVYVDIIDNKSLNARVARKGDEHFIGIYRGAIDVLTNIFFRMLSNKNVLKEVGDISLEKGVRKIFDAQATNTEHLQTEYLADLMPCDKDRKMMAHVYILEVIEFLVLHEFAHIISGHLDHDKLSFRTQALPFRNEGEEENLSVFQTFEVIADDFAVRMKLNILNGVDKNEVIQRHIKDHDQEWPITIREWLFPLYTFFRLFGDTNFHYSLHSHFHPPPAARFNMILNNIGYCMEDKFGFSDSGRLSEVFVDAMMEVERAFDEISEQGLDLRSIEFSFDKTVTEYCQKLLDQEPAVARAFAGKYVSMEDCLENLSGLDGV